MHPKKPWSKTTTIYQVYPRSYKDSNGDGIGDIPGIISKLDHIQDLGFETIWFSPFFSSPQEDWGYDVSDYRQIAPEYGTLADVEQLIAEIHKRGMKVLFDLVLNHTSDQHPWFRESSSSPQNPKSDWYIWRDGKGPGRPPTNWKALPGGSGWHYHPTRGQWYYASFLPFQPDLNWRNPAVKGEMFRIIEFWLDKGVDGFRLDIFHVIYKDSEFRDNPWHWSYIPKDDQRGFFTKWIYTINQPETIELARELRQLLNGYKPERVMLGEIFGEDSQIKKYLNGGNSGLHLMFLWDLMHFRFKADFVWKILHKYEMIYPPPYTPVLVFGNHDSRRWIDRLGGDIRKAKLIALLQLTARGVPVVYYGEEIGLPEGKIPVQSSLDPIAKKYIWAPNWLFKAFALYSNRDNCRTPMAWTSSVNGGFTSLSAKPWLPLSGSPEAVNVLDQEEDPDSLLTWYKKLIHARNDLVELNSGSLDLLPFELSRKGLLGFYRSCEGRTLAILINFSSNPIEIDLPQAEAQLTTGAISSAAGKIQLGELSGGIFRLYAGASGSQTV